MSRPADPLGTALTWVWALGTASGLAMTGLLAQDKYAAAQASSVNTSLAIDGTGPDDGSGKAARLRLFPAAGA
ncbi:hypothetical protein ACFYWN_42615 [Streptomyces sp. NPDC002917]|uniref:hypothetical protein n=1 Tax=Streptomyces sp. NPDC002917 TaxID=3364671 RepID=UPI0036860326